MRQLQFALLLLMGTLQYSLSARILVFFPLPWRSHHSVVRPLVKALATRGHQVDYYTPLSVPNPPKGLRQFILNDYSQEGNDELSKILDVKDLPNLGPAELLRITVHINLIILDKVFQEETVVNLLRSNETYDAVLSEFPLASESTSYLAHKFKALSIVILSFPDFPWLNELSGLPDNPSYMINYMTPISDSLNFNQRLYNTYIVASITLYSYWAAWTKQNAFAERVIKYDGWDTRPPLFEMMSQTALVFTNSHVSVGFPHPRAPHVKEIAGINVDPSPLPQDLQDFMDNAPHGVIFFSLGSILDPSQWLANGKFEIFLSVFRKLKQKVMWKVSQNMQQVDEPNVRFGTWYPQQGILAHKNLKMFITHGGLQSMIEAISFGVPCLGMPGLFDQMKDVAIMKKIGMGLELEFDNVTEATVLWSINEVLTNPRYREQAKKQQALFHDRPNKPVDEAVYWIEYVLRHGNILRPASATMPFYKLYLLDVLAVVILTLILLLYVTKFVWRRVFSLFAWRLSNTSKMERSPKKKLN